MRTPRPKRPPGRLRRALPRLLFAATLPLVAILVFGLLHGGLPVGPASAAAPGEWAGVFHVHSSASDGSGTLDEIAAAARAEGLDFVVVTDHNRFAAPEHHYRDGVLLVVGEEANTDMGEHLVVIGGADPRERRDRGERLAVPTDPDPTLRVIAHPMGPGRPWRRGYPPSIDAMEIWNADTERRDDPLTDMLGALALLPTHPVAGLYRLVDRPAASLALWDSLQARPRGMAGVCAVDAHQRIPLAPVDLKLPRYRQSFRFARMHLVLGGPPTGDAMADAATVVEALREGRSYCGFDGLADARGVRFEVASAMTTAGPGESIAWTPGATLRVELPPAGAEARIRLYRDGVDVATGSGRTWSTPLERPGVYRIEAELDAPRDGRGWLPWILTNPVRVGV